MVSRLGEVGFVVLCMRRAGAGLIGVGRSGMRIGTVYVQSRCISITSRAVVCGLNEASCGQL